MESSGASSVVGSASPPKDIEKADLPISHDPFNENGKFDLDTHLHHMREKAEDLEIESRTMGVAWRNLGVTGVGSGLALQTTVGSLLTEPLRAPQLISGLLHPPIKHILQGLDGCVKPGEMLLVLGRPGSGCTTFLKTIASYRAGFKAINGEILYQGFDHRQIEGLLRADVVYTPEDDVHFPTLTVGQTLDFAAASRAPQAKRRIDLEGKASRKSYINLTKETLGAILGLRHTFNTLVGNELIRGVSGGEKKRVSIAEALASRAKITCFDNSSRGLDSSTALDFVQSLRTATDVGTLTTLCSLYQAGEGMVNLFDKVIVLNEGHCVYFGPYSRAFDYFYAMGYEPQPRQTTADFLVACTDAVGRRLREGYESRAPRTAEEQAEYFRNSLNGQRNREETDAYFVEMRERHTAEERARYQKLARQEKAKRVPRRSPFILNYFQQTKLCIRRRAQIMWGDRLTTIIITIASIMQALIIGSTFYDIPDTTAGFFSRGGVLFFMILYQSFLAAAEIPNSYAQRPVVIRHKQFAFSSPSADALANTLLDIPVRLVSMTGFIIIVYFMTGLSTTLASQFFVLYGIVALTTFTMVAAFRALAAIFRAESTATLCSGLMIIATALYAGYVIPRPSMVIWWKWISYAQPIAYSFEVLVGNEFRTLNVPCAQLIPAGPAYATVSTANQVCPVAGARPGQTLVNGLDYSAFSYGYYWSNRSRNAGIIIAFFVFSVAVYALASEFQSDPSAAGGIMVFKRSGAPKEVVQATKAHGDLENGKSRPATPDGATAQDRDAAVAGIETSTEIFSWHKINYDVLVKKKTRRLLSDVDGYVKPGSLVALMGASGAGKTTLLNVLAHRAGTGVVTGELKLSGRQLPRSFQASTGYCQQQDVHLATASVREALRFSAVLRQPAEIPLQEKYDYVEKVIHMLEMESFAEAVVGDVGMGLNVEQRKRLTIAVELAAKPKLLLFLDEPTSGLDGQAAWSIVRFLRKLADAGQAILCTIHQPSGELFNVFDRLLLLQRGGKTVYFGDIGERSMKVANYFQHHSGKPCNDGDNVAEYMLDVIGAGATGNSKQDWHQLFRESEMYSQLQQDLQEITNSERPPLSAGDEARGRREYAAGFFTQFKTVLTRTWLHYWRDPVYLGSKIGLCVVAGLFIGSSFWGQGSLTSVASLQNKLFSVFMSLVLSTSLAQQMQPLFISFRNLYEARERPSKLYNWLILPVTFLLVEIPWNAVAGTLFWAPWFFMTRFNPGQSSRAAFSWFYVCILFQVYWASFAAAVAAVAPNAMLASVLFSFFFR